MIAANTHSPARRGGESDTGYRQSMNRCPREIINPLRRAFVRGRPRGEPPRLVPSAMTKKKLECVILLVFTTPATRSSREREYI
jgi:hypothetical protein